MAKLQPAKYEVLLKEPLACFHCDVEKKNLPTLKTHLQEGWEKLKAHAESRKKRKLEFDKPRDVTSPNAADGGDASPAQKKFKSNES
jgi:aprataxin